MTVGFQMWQLLRYPPTRHRLFRYTSRMVPEQVDMPPGRAVQFAMAVVILLTLVISPTLFVVLIGVVPVFIILFVLLMSGTVYGLWRGIQAVTRLVKLRHDGWYEALFALPEGEVGLLTVVNAAYLHRGDLLREIHGIMKALTRIILGGVGLVSLFLAVSIISAPATVSGEPGSLLVLGGLMPVAAIALILYLDFLYSIVVANLIAALVASKVRHRFEAQMWTLLFYMGIQLTQYLICLLIFLMVVYAAHLLVDVNTVVHIGLTFSAVPIFYIVREAVTGLLWRLFLQQTGTTVPEWRAFRQWWHQY